MFILWQALLKNTLPILSYLIFNNILLVFLKPEKSKEQNNKESFDFTWDTAKGIKQQQKKQKEKG